MIPFLLFLLLACPLHADDSPRSNPIQREVVAEWDLLSFIGMNPLEALEILGPPGEIYPYRGREDWQDNVVFFYSDRLYLFWYDNRVWQIRLDGNYTGLVFDFSMGDSKEKILDSMGKPFARDDRSLIYFLPDKGYPVKMRLFFEENRLSDFYLYRGDF